MGMFQSQQWDYYTPPYRRRLIATAVGAGPTGSGAITEAADVIAGIGTVNILGSGAITEAADAIAGTGTLGVAGSGAITGAADVVAGTGTVNIIGTGAITLGGDTIAGTGSTAGGTATPNAIGYWNASAVAEAEPTDLVTFIDTLTLGASDTITAVRFMGYPSTYGGAPTGRILLIRTSDNHVMKTLDVLVNANGMAMWEYTTSWTAPGAGTYRLGFSQNGAIPGAGITLGYDAGVDGNTHIDTTGGTYTVGSTFTETDATGYGTDRLYALAGDSLAAGNSGSGAITEAADVIAGTGKVNIIGSGTVTEAADVIAGTGHSGNTGTGAVTEAADTIAAVGFYFGTGNHAQYNVDPTTWRTDAGSIGSAVTGTPAFGDKVILPTKSVDGTIDFTWELDSAGNATGALASVSGSGNSTTNNWGFYDSTTPVWRFATFDTSSGAISGSGTVTETADTVAGTGFYFGTGAHIQYNINPATWRTDAGSLGSSVTGTPTANDKLLVPSTSPDGSLNYIWELDSNGNATGALSSVSGAGLSASNNWGLFDSTTSTWRFATFDTSLGSSGSGAITEAADVIAGTGKVNIIGSGTVTEAADIIAGTGSTDVTAPAFTAGPAAASIQANAYLVNFTTNEGGHYRTVTLLPADPPPNASEVLLGTGSGGSTPVHASALGTMTAAVSSQVSVTGVLAAQGYITYVAVVDSTGNTRIASVAVTTSAAPDTTAPSFTTGPVIDQIFQTSARLSGITDESGVYGVAVLPAASSQPIASVIFAGTAGGPYSLTSAPMVLNVQFLRGLTGLQADTDYKVHTALKDAANNTRVISTGPFRTAAALNTGIVETVQDVDSGALVTSVTGVKVCVRVLPEDSTAPLYNSTTGSIDSNGVLQFASTAIGNVDDVRYMTLRWSEGLVEKAGLYRVLVKDLG